MTNSRRLLTLCNWPLARLTNTYLRTTYLIAAYLITALLFASKANGEDWVYTVKPGDTLWDLCRQYTTKRNCWQEVGPYNGVEYPPSMAPGTRVRFPVAWLKMQPAPATLLFFTGDVSVQVENGEPRPALLGESLSMGSAVRTGPLSAASVQFADGALLFLEADSELQLDSLSRHSSTGMVDTQVRLNRGAGRAKVPVREPRSEFRIATPSAIAAVRGTEYRVSAQAESTLSSVYESTISVSTSAGKAGAAGNAVSVPEKFGLVAKKDAPLGEPEALLPAVTFKHTKRWLSTNEVVTWAPIDQGHGYSIEWLSQGDNAGIVAAEHINHEQASLPAALSAGQCYELQVRAMSLSGLQGMQAVREVCVASALGASNSITISKRTLHWGETAGAKAYRVELSQSRDFSTIEQSVTVTDNQWPIDYQGKNTVYMRVIALDSHDVEGQTSDAVSYQPKSFGKLILMSAVFVLIAIL